MHLDLSTRPTPTVAAPILAAATAVIVRMAGTALCRPVGRFIAGGTGLIAGWSMVEGLTLQSRTLPAVGLAVLLVAGLAVRDVAKSRPASTPEPYFWIAALALFTGVWIGLPTWPHILAAAGVIAATAVLADQGWSIAAAALTLAAALAAIGAPAIAAATALVVAAACLGAGPVLPLAIGLGAATAQVLIQALAAPHHRQAVVFACLAPVACMLLIRWWRTRFTRLGRAADPTRALVAATLVVAVAFSAAAMAHLR